MTLREICILADENISPKLVQFLRSEKLDVFDVKEQNWNGKPDQELLKISYRQKRWRLTHDSDFGTLAIHHGAPFHGIIFLRLKNAKPDNVIRVCRSLLQQDFNDPSQGLIIVDENKIRIREYK